MISSIVFLWVCCILEYPFNIGKALVCLLFKIFSFMSDTSRLFRKLPQQSLLSKEEDVPVNKCGQHIEFKLPTSIDSSCDIFFLSFICIVIESCMHNDGHIFAVHLPPFYTLIPFVALVTIFFGIQMNSGCRI